MNEQVVTEVAENFDSESLKSNFEFAVDTGETPYQKNRQALIEIDLRHNNDKGLKLLNETLAGIDDFIADLEWFRNASHRIAKSAASALRQG